MIRSQTLETLHILILDFDRVFPRHFKFATGTVKEFGPLRVSLSQKYKNCINVALRVAGLIGLMGLFVFLKNNILLQSPS